MHVGIFDLEHVNLIWGHLVQFSKNLACKSKMAYHRVKRTKIRASGVFVACMMVFLTMKMSRSFGVIWDTFPEKPCNPRTAHRRAIGTKTWAPGRGRGMYIACILVFLTLNMSRSFGSFGALGP